MSEEVKVYVEAYGALWEVIDPIFESDGTISSDKYRRADEPDAEYYLSRGSFRDAIVYEDLNGLLERVLVLGDESGCGCDADEACSDCPENITGEHYPLSLDVIEFGGAMAEAIEALLEVARDERVDAIARIAAADRVLGTYLGVAQA